MKKTIVIYYLLVNLICFILSLLGVIKQNTEFNTLFFLTFSLLSLIVTTLLILKKSVKYSLFFLAITNFLQAFTFVFSGFSYKLLLCPEVSFYIINDGNFVARFSALPYNIIFYVNSFKIDDNYMFGLNFIHIFLFLFFNNLLLLERKNSEK